MPSATRARAASTPKKTLRVGMPAAIATSATLRAGSMPRTGTPLRLEVLEQVAVVAGELDDLVAAAEAEAVHHHADVAARMGQHRVRVGREVGIVGKDALARASPPATARESTGRRQRRATDRRAPCRVPTAARHRSWRAERLRGRRRCASARRCSSDMARSWHSPESNQVRCAASYRPFCCQGKGRSTRGAAAGTSVPFCSVPCSPAVARLPIGRAAEGGNYRSRQRAICYEASLVV